MKKHIGIMLIYLRNSIMNQMEYRINFISSILLEIAYFFVKLTYVFVVVSTQMTIGDLGPYHIVTFIGVFTTFTGIFCLFSPGIFSFSNKVYSGELDYFITKPVSLLVISSLCQHNIGNTIADVTSGAALIIWGLSKTKEMITVSALALGILLMLYSVVIAYFLFLLPQLLSFWILKVNKMSGLLWSLYDFNNMPMIIYPKSLQMFFIYIIPIFLLTNPTGYAFLGRFKAWMLLSMVGVNIVLCGVFYLMWKKGLRRYHSSNMG